MTKATDGINYKLPPEFMAAHGDVVRAWDWGASPILALKAVLPGIKALEDVRLHLRGEGEAIVCPVGGGSAIRLRRYNDTLPQFPKPTPEEVAAVLAKRNPQKDRQA